MLETDDARARRLRLHVHDRPRQRPRDRGRPPAGAAAGRPRSWTSCVGDPGSVYRELAADSQLRWLGPEKGVVHLALAAVMNAVWDLAARRAGKPLWRLLADMSSEELVAAADFRYISDVLTRGRGA